MAVNGNGVVPGSSDIRDSERAKPKMGSVKKVKILTALLSIFLIGCFASARAPKFRAEPDGFREIKWGTDIATLKDMEKVEQDRSPGSDLAWYTRKGDPLAIGKAELEKIFYSFWMGSFQGVWIDIKGDENFAALKRELFERFGKVLESEELMKKMDSEAGREPSTIRRSEEFYAWWGKDTEMTLSYSKDRHKGTLSINSKKISEERGAYEKQKGKQQGPRE